MKSKWIRMGFLGFFLFLLCLMTAAPTVSAASDFRLIPAVDKKAQKEGTWLRDEAGLRYVYTDGKYPRKVWLKISGGYYYFDGNGYVRTGWVKFKGNRYYLSTVESRRGRLLLGFQKINGKVYYFSKKYGQMLYGWQKIGGSWYHFDTKTGVRDTSCWVEGRYLKKNGKMAVNQWADGAYVGSDGYVDEEITAAGVTELPADLNITTETDAGSDTNTNANTETEKKEEASKVIFVGDSRTVGMSAYVSSKSAVFIGKVGSGYSWLSTKVERKLAVKLKKYPASKVIFNFGVNDWGNLSNYIVFYKKLIAKYPKAQFYFLSVNPIDSTKGSFYLTNKDIKSFNKALKTAFPKQFINSYQYLMKKGFSTVDGLHYTGETYKLIYNYVMKKII